MSNSGVFELTAFTAIAAGDVLPMVDIDDLTQSANGSLDKITVTNFFKLIPVAASTFGATALPAGIVSLHPNGLLMGFTPDVATNVARSTVLLMLNYGATTSFYGAAASGTVTAPTAKTAGPVWNLGTEVYDGTAWGEGSYIQFMATENFAVGAHGSSIEFHTVAVGATTDQLSLTLSNTGTTTRLRPAATAMSWRNSADSADNLIIVDAGAATFRTSVTATTTVNATTGMTFGTSVISTTALATPSALSATQFTGFASTVSGAAIMGYGTTNDVVLMNRAGTVCLGVGPNTTMVNIPGSLTVTGAINSQTISSAANFTGTVTTAGLITANVGNTLPGITISTNDTTDTHNTGLRIQGTATSGSGILGRVEFYNSVAGQADTPMGNLKFYRDGANNSSGFAVRLVAAGVGVDPAFQVASTGVVTLSGYGSGSGVVSVGAADSGGAGFKLLRVPN